MTPSHSRLFSPVEVGALHVRNRVWVSPMCQYSCVNRDGIPTEWHLVHLGSMAAGGFGLIITEASAVDPLGRISPEDAGLWGDEHTAAWRPIVDFVHGQGAAIVVQLSHAGRKGSTQSLLLGRGGSLANEDGGWETVGPSAGAFGDLRHCRAMSQEEIAAVPAQFANAARRADDAGFDAVEIHAAHGYLLHQFLSPLINTRNDEYGGNLANRVRLLREVVAAVREELSTHKPVMVRVSATDWAEGGWDMAQTIELSRLLVEDGVDLVDVSSGGAVAHQKIAVGPRYQLPFAEQVHATGAMTATVGLIESPLEAEHIIEGNSADVVLLGRAALREPRWPLRAAAELGVPADDAPYPPQYRRGAWPAAPR